MENMAEILDRLDMMQSYLQHLGDRIDILMRMQRRDAKENFQPPSMTTRRSKLIEVIKQAE